MRAMARRAREEGGASMAPGKRLPQAGAGRGGLQLGQLHADDAALAPGDAAAADRRVEQRKFLRGHWLRSYLSDSPDR